MEGYCRNRELYAGHVPELGQKILFEVEGCQIETTVMSRHFDLKSKLHYITTTDFHYRVIFCHERNDGEWFWLEDDTKRDEEVTSFQFVSPDQHA